MTREVLTSPLNQKRFGVAVFVALPSTAREGFRWFWVDPSSHIIGTPTLPLASAHFHCALSYDSERVLHHWIPSTTDPRPHGRPLGAPTPAPTDPSTEASMNANADILLQHILQPRRSAVPALAADDVPDTTAAPEEEEPDLLDTATSEAFARLLTALDTPDSTGPILDAPLYTVLSRLSHAHPWTTLILDLKDLMPELDRHYHHHLLVALLQPNPQPITATDIIDQFLYCLALTITNILTNPNSQVDPPEIDAYFFHPTFWHRHLIHGTNSASPASFDASLTDTLAGNQLCQWSTVGAADALLLASHVIIHLPPRVGAYVLASHPDLAKITSDHTSSTANPRSHFTVRHNAQFRSPQHIPQPQHAIMSLRSLFPLWPPPTPTSSTGKSTGPSDSLYRLPRSAIRKHTGSQILPSAPPVTEVRPPCATHSNSPMYPRLPHMTLPTAALSASPTPPTAPGQPCKHHSLASRGSPPRFIPPIP